MQTSEQILDDLLGKGIGRGKGRTKVLSMEFSRELDRDDILALAAPMKKQGTPVQNLRSSHHYLAKLLAEGRKNTEASLITGYSLGRIIQLKNDPARPL